jgi:hypothetical protein
MAFVVLLAVQLQNQSSDSPPATVEDVYAALSAQMKPAAFLRSVLPGDPPLGRAWLT